MVNSEYSHEHNKLGKNLSLYSFSEDIKEIGINFKYDVKESLFDNIKETHINLKPIK
jgi:hypothetical protein